jgi:hypothetical protein
MDSKTSLKLPESIRYGKYYEYDGRLRAYANRSMVFAFLFAILAFVMTGFAIYLRRQPPLIIQVSDDGEARLLIPDKKPPTTGPSALTVSARPRVPPSDMEILKILTQFLTRYLSHNPANIESNLAEALNLMTVNLRRSALNQLRETDLVGKVKEQNLTSDIKITSNLPSKDIQYAFTVLVVKEVRQVRKGVENTDRIVGAHYVRLVTGGTVSRKSLWGIRSGILGKTGLRRKG